jgi:hypothetical protein
MLRLEHMISAARLAVLACPGHFMLTVTPRRCLDGDVHSSILGDDVVSQLDVTFLLSTTSSSTPPLVMG